MSIQDSLSVQPLVFNHTTSETAEPQNRIQSPLSLYLSSYLPRPVVSIIENYAKQPLAIIFLSLSTILDQKAQRDYYRQMASQVSVPDENALYTLDQQALTSLQSLIQTANQHYDIGIVIQFSLRKTRTLDKLMQHLSPTYPAIAQLIIGEITFSLSSLSSRQAAAAKPSLPRLMGEITLGEQHTASPTSVTEWLFRNLHRNAKHMVVITQGISNSTLLALRSITCTTLNDSTRILAEKILTTEGFTPQVLLLFDKYNISSPAEVKIIESLMQTEQSHTEIQDITAEQHLLFTRLSEKINCLISDQIANVHRTPGGRNSEKITNQDLSTLAGVVVTILECSNALPSLRKLVGETVARLKNFLYRQRMHSLTNDAPPFELGIHIRTFHCFKLLVEKMPHIKAHWETLTMSMLHPSFPDNLKREFYSLLNQHALEYSNLPLFNLVPAPNSLQVDLKLLEAAHEVFLTLLQKKTTHADECMKIIRDVTETFPKGVMEESYQQSFVNVIFTIIYDQDEPLQRRQRVASLLINSCIEYLTTPVHHKLLETPESQKYVLKALMQIASSIQLHELTITNSAELIKLFLALCNKSKRSNLFAPYAFQCGRALLDSPLKGEDNIARKNEIINAIMRLKKPSPSTPNDDDYAIDFFFYLLGKISDNSLLLGLSKAYLDTLVKIYIENKAQLDSDERMQKMGFIAYVRERLHQTAELLVHFTALLTSKGLTEAQ